MSDTKWLEKQKHFDWMQKCLTCWKMCEEFILQTIESGKYVTAINYCRDTAEICSQCIKFEAQRSPFLHQLCEVGAAICETCATEIEKYKSKDEIFTATIKSCRTFAAACRIITLHEENTA